jgi:hypothetical protein
MIQYGILNSRKRAIIALVHTVVFGSLAAVQLAIRQHPRALVSSIHGSFAAPLALTLVYLIVSIVLLILFRYSKSAIERLYFASCAASASVGLLRCLLGDPTAYLGNGIRVLLLGAAVLIGVTIVKDHSQMRAQFAD